MPTWTCPRCKTTYAPIPAACAVCLQPATVSAVEQRPPPFTRDTLEAIAQHMDAHRHPSSAIIVRAYAATLDAAPGPTPCGCTMDRDSGLLANPCAYHEEQRAAIAAMRQALGLEVCVCAAIVCDDGTIVRGHRHDDCLKTHGNIPLEHRPKFTRKPEAQGFMTTRNRFVTRDEGLSLQLSAGIESKRGFYQDELYSEDLY